MRSPNSRIGRNRIVGIGAVFLAAASVTGCREYLDNRETITLEVGDSIAVNHATQTIERWPRASARDRWLSDGERARTAVEAYRERKTPEPETDAATQTTGN